MEAITPLNIKDNITKHTTQDNIRLPTSKDIKVIIRFAEGAELIRHRVPIIALNAGAGYNFLNGLSFLIQKQRKD